ncbi:hypothetical protein D3C80_1149490 [compost metagenome]
MRPFEVEEHEKIKERRNTKRHGGDDQRPVRRGDTGELRLIQPVRPSSSQKKQCGGMADEDEDQGKVDHYRQGEFQNNDRQRREHKTCQHRSSAVCPDPHQAAKGDIDKRRQAGGKDRQDITYGIDAIPPAQADKNRLDGAKRDQGQEGAVRPHIVSASEKDDEHDDQQKRHDEWQGNEKHE